VDRLRVAIASLALLVPSVVFALNAFISYRERGLVETYDVPAAIAFLITAVLAWWRSLVAVVGGAILCAIYLASVVASGPLVFTAYWIVALVLIVQAVPLVRHPAVSST
jgi:Na+-transporting NADH:ubiquinone oxidoreductase subunit NqrB